jgi:hypothetical protein
MKIDMPHLMDNLRKMALKEKIPAKEPNIALFHQLFLNSVKRWGRVHEVELIGLYKLKSGQLFADMQLGQQMFMKGKLTLLPDGIRDKKGVKNIFERINR